MAEKHRDAHVGEDLKLVLLITFITLAVEVAGGYWSNSLALLSDAGSDGWPGFMQKPKCARPNCPF